MRILIFSQYFTPEVTAAPVRLHPLAAGLARLGHEVEVICEIPNHPQGLLHPGYGERLVDRRALDGFAATYVRVTVNDSKRARARLASYASYAAMGAAVGALRRRPDVIVASSPPLSVGAVGALAAAYHRVPWVFDVRDLWPEAAVVLGELSNARIISLAERLERRLYASAAAITTPTEPFRAHISALSAESKVSVLANGTTREWLEAGAAEPDRAGLGLPADRFVWTYAGNVGLSQDLDNAVSAAEMLGDGFQLVIVGEGASRQRLEQRVARSPAAQARFTGLVSARDAARYMRASDALLVPLADTPALGKSIPIKLYDCCAIGRPVVLAAPGEPRRIAEREQLAVVVDPGDPVALAAAVRTLADDEALRGRLATAARDFAGRHLRERQVDEMDALLRQLDERR